VRLVEEVTAQRKHGYARVLVAGQSFGGLLALEAATKSRDVYAAVGFAPGLRPRSRAESCDPRVATWRLKSLVVERVAVVFPAQDDVFDNAVRGPDAAATLSRTGRPFWLVDETGGLTGHGGAMGGVFALRYGMCLVEFLTAPQLPAGRFECRPPADEWAVARELLPRSPAPWRPMADEPDLPEGLRSLTGTWYGTFPETDEIVLFFLTRSARGELHAVLGSTGRIRGGGLYTPSVGERGLRVTSTSKAVATVAPKPPDLAELVFAALDGTWTYRVPLRRAPEP